MEYPSGLINLSVERLHPHPDNPRKDLGDLTELAASIKENGIFQNLTVVADDPTSTVSDFTVIIGHRRLAAAKLAGLTEVPCVIVEMTQKEQVQTMLLENMQRSDLTVYEQAQGFQMMLDLGSTVEEIAEKSGFSQSTVRRRVKMMELDQTKLKEVSVRQLSLADFDTLAQIEDIKKRNEVLESIGTRDFDANVSRALSVQKERANRPLVKKWLKDVGATEISQQDTWSNKYESYPGCGYYIYLSRWGEENNTPPKTLKDPVFYRLESSSLRLYKKREKPPKEKKPAAQLAKEKAIREAWKSLEESASLAYDLRKQFVARLTVTAKNRQAILYGALTAHLMEAIDYNSPDRDGICKLLGLDTGYMRDRSEKMEAAITELEETKLPALIYACFGDGAKETCTGTTYHGDWPAFHRSVKLKLIYEWLQLLGYEPSTEELQILSGAHEAFHAKEAYDADK